MLSQKSWEGAQASMYRLEKIRKVFNGHLVAVDDVSLKITPGEQVAVIGPSGAGKTTLFRLLNLTLRPDGGVLWLGDLDEGIEEAAKAAGFLK